LKKQYEKEFAIKTIKKLWPKNLPLNLMIEFVNGEFAQSCIALPFNKTGRVILDIAIKDIREEFFPAIMANEIAHYVVFLKKPKVKFWKFRRFLGKIKNIRLETCLYNLVLWITGLRLRDELEDDKVAIRLLVTAGYSEEFYRKFLEDNIFRAERSKFPERIWKKSLARNRLRKFQKEHKRG